MNTISIPIGLCKCGCGRATKFVFVGGNESGKDYYNDYILGHYRKPKNEQEILVYLHSEESLTDRLGRPPILQEIVEDVHRQVNLIRKLQNKKPWDFSEAKTKLTKKNFEALEELKTKGI